MHPRTVVVVVVAVVLFASFCWFDASAPAAASLTLAVAAAVAWSMWLEKDDGAPRAKAGRAQRPSSPR